MDFFDLFNMTIDGAQTASAKRIAVYNPATGEVFAHAPDCTPAQLESAVAAAEKAFRSWRATPLEERRARLIEAAACLRRNIDPLAHLFTREHGRPVEGARQEIEDAARWIEAVAQMPIPEHVYEDSDAQRVETRYVAIGVVCAIAPWNFPVSLAVWKVAPALLAGNTVVLKPSPFTPLCTLKVGELFSAIFPPGVLNVVSGGDQLGPLMTQHPGFAKISFTGSTATGKRVMQSAAQDLKRVTLELGGNDAAIVMPDIDVDEVAQKIFFSSFINTAQICVATKRLYVHEAIYDRLRDALVAIAKNAVVGDGAEQGVLLGPIQNKRQYDRVIELIKDARRQRLALIQGASVPVKGYFVPVTIVDNPPDDARVVREEAFGPVLPMLRFSSVDDVVRRANDSEFGLAASIWSKDLQAATAIAEQLDVGTVWINQVINLRPDTPFAGRKKSGLGVENGLDGLLEYMAPKSTYLSKAQTRT